MQTQFKPSKIKKCFRWPNAKLNAYSLIDLEWNNKIDKDFNLKLSCISRRPMIVTELFIGELPVVPEWRPSIDWPFVDHPQTLSTTRQYNPNAATHTPRGEKDESVRRDERENDIGTPPAGLQLVVGAGQRARGRWTRTGNASGGANSRTHHQGDDNRKGSHLAPVFPLDCQLLLPAVVQFGHAGPGAEPTGDHVWLRHVQSEFKVSAARR